jgi:hypothetical protein
LFHGGGTIPLFLDLLILLGFVILLFSLSLFIFKKRIRQEFWKEVKIMCQDKSGCAQPENLKGKPENCSVEQIAICHPGEKAHPCERGEGDKED